MKSWILICLVVNGLLIGSCHAQNNNIVIRQNPIFSETDSFTSITKYTQHNKDDYFLIKGNINDKNKLKKYIDSFVKKNASEEFLKYDNYSVAFYVESKEINEKKILEEPYATRYKLFSENKSDLIVSYSYYNSKLISIDYNSKFK